MSAKKFNIVCYDLEKLTVFLEDNKYSIREYLYIYHIAESEETKDHFHVFVEFFNPKNHSTIAKSLNVNIQLVQTCKDKIKLFRYFLHIDQLSKIKYDIGDLVTNIDYNIIYNIVNIDNFIKSDEEYLSKQLEYLHNGLSLNDIIQISISDKQLHYLRKYWNIIKYYYDHITIFLDK